MTVQTPLDTLKREYVGNNIYENGSLKRILVDGGYIQDGQYCFFLTDHLGNTRVVAKADGTVLQTNHYYPYGLPFAEGVEDSDQPYKYNGKEFDPTCGLNLYDYGARLMDPTLGGRFTTPDPLAEKYGSFSPYAYCGGNPVKYIDPDGRMVGDFMDERGRYLGNDGIDDNKVYVIKTAQTSFGQGNSAVPGAGNTEVKATIAFIKANSGNTAAFANNPIAYNNSVQIEGETTNRQAMVSTVSLDTGRGGTSAANNREYGGTISNGSVVVAPPGDVANPQTDASASILLPEGVSTFHSHPSGNVVVGSGANILGGTTTTYGFTQSPSPQDISQAGSQIHYVFGRGDNTVYIYNSQGVQATLPMVRFVTPKR